MEEERLDTMDIKRQREQVEPTSPMHPAHPSHPDSHHHRAYHPHVKLLREILGVFILFVIVIMAAEGMITNAPFDRVILGFSPVILLSFIAISLINTDYFNLKLLGVALVVLIVIIGIFLSYIMPDLEVTVMAGINLVLGALLLVVLSQAHIKIETPATHIVPEQQPLTKMVATIEDKCKALNFVIGRVYSVHHGASTGMRDKIKIDPAWYNEFNNLRDDPEGNKNIILGLVEKIKRRLETLEKEERDVFTTAEVGKLKNLKRDELGKTKVITVLGDNDNDPAQQYYKGALQYCDMALDKLKHL